MRFCPVCNSQLDIEKTIESEEGIGFLLCRICSYHTRLDEGMLILSLQRKAKNLSVTTFDPEAATYDTYPRKKIRECVNKKCGKDVEAIVWKDDNFNVRYICTKCKEVMKP